ncbi:RNA transcription, translation and transport factor protein [Brevipalpus obovatus]|uniref:RNA transcription, translation and transport factor protein n=1 Tax=Brevipalpus obovatus TaxID=246614 RepID=UPI003D9E6083
MNVSVSGDQRSSDCKPAKYRIQENPLDNLDFASDEFKAGVAELAAMLKIPEHPDHLITLGAISHLVQTRLNSDALRREEHSADSKSNVESRKKMDDKALTLDTTSLGFQVSDKQLERPAKVLRMLYLNDMRDLQNNINRTIVKIQEITAHPKTDSNLGQVGR